MKVAVFSTKPYDRDSLTRANVDYRHELTFIEPRLTRETVSLAAGYDAVCVFVNDQLDAGVLLLLQRQGVKLIALRCAGFNNVDVPAAATLGLSVVRVPAYSPDAVAEHTLALILALERKIHRAYNRVREGNFSLDGLLGRELCDQTVGVVGTGQIGAIVVRILRGFGSKVVCYDVKENPEVLDLGAKYLPVSELFEQSDIVSLHVPLLPQTVHIVNGESLARMKRGAILINTSRGGLVDTRAVIDSLKTGKLGGLGIDVYEEERDLFFADLSNEVIRDDVFARLLTFPNVIITGHQAFFTEKALRAIAHTTLGNITQVAAGEPCPNVVVPKE